MSAVVAAGLVVCLRAEEITLKDGRVFKDAQVISQSPTKVLIRYQGGMSSVAKSLLPEKLLAQYPVDGKGAAEAARKEAMQIALQPKIPLIKLTNGRIFPNVRITGQSAGRIWITNGQTGESVDKRLLPQWLREQYPIYAEALAREKADSEKTIAANQAELDKQRAGEKERLEAVAIEAREYADAYFRYRYPVGSGNFHVVSLKLPMEPPRKVEGWTNRYSVEGRCFMEYYEGANGDFVRHVADAFTLTLEGKVINGAEDFKVVDYSKHYAPVSNVP